MTIERHKAREMILQALYEIDAVGHDPTTVINRVLKKVQPKKEIIEFILTRVHGVLDSRDALDLEIQHRAPVWPLTQMALVDRNILRLALFEIIRDNSVPVKVAINEAVELAKSYGGDQSYRFVNGVLGSVGTIYDR